MNQFIDPDDRGHWEGDRFVFTPPLVFADEGGEQRVVRELDCSQMALPDDISRDDVVHALLNPLEPDEQWQRRERP